VKIGLFYEIKRPILCFFRNKRSKSFLNIIYYFAISKIISNNVISKNSLQKYVQKVKNQRSENYYLSDYPERNVQSKPRKTLSIHWNIHSKGYWNAQHFHLHHFLLILIPSKIQGENCTL
jgi:hypothetical protein